MRLVPAARLSPMHYASTNNSTSDYTFWTSYRANFKGISANIEFKNTLFSFGMFTYTCEHQDIIQIAI
jgi:hypothetical protein